MVSVPPFWSTSLRIRSVYLNILSHWVDTSSLNSFMPFLKSAVGIGNSRLGFWNNCFSFSLFFFFCDWWLMIYFVKSNCNELLQFSISKIFRFFKFWKTDFSIKSNNWLPHVINFRKCDIATFAGLQKIYIVIII